MNMPFPPSLLRKLPPQRGRKSSFKLQTEATMLDLLRRIPTGATSLSQTSERQAMLSQRSLAHWFDEASLRQADAEHWRWAILASLLLRVRLKQHPTSTLMQLCLHWHPLEFACTAYFAALALLEKNGYAYFLIDHSPGCAEVAACLATAAESTYRHALGSITAQEPENDQQRYARAAVFHTEPELIDAALDTLGLDTDSGFHNLPGIVALPLTLKQAERLVSSPSRRETSSTAAVFALNLLCLHGDAAMPLIAILFQRVLQFRELRAQRESVGRLADVLSASGSPLAFELLLSAFGFPEVRAAIDDFAQRFPTVAIEAARTLRDHGATAELHDWLEALLASEQCVKNDSSIAALPQPVSETSPEQADGDGSSDPLIGLLRNAPWLLPQPKRPRVKLPDAPPPPPQFCWPEGLRAKWKSLLPEQGDPGPHLGSRYTRQQLALLRLAIPESLWPSLLSGEVDSLDSMLPKLEAEARRVNKPFRPLGELAVLPPPLRRLFWNDLSFEQSSGPRTVTAGSLLAHYELEALPGLLRLTAHQLDLGLEAALPVASAEFAVLAVQGLQLKRARPHAMAWLIKHAELATLSLLPLIAEGRGELPVQAEAALRNLAHEVDPERLREGARHYDNAGLTLLDFVLSKDPLTALPRKPRSLPSFYRPTAFARPILCDGASLPDDCLEALGTILQASSLQAPYAGVQLIKSSCTQASLDAFVWDLFIAWTEHGGDSKEAWAYTAIGLLGGDDCVRRLSPLIRRWPSEGLHARAVTGLDILAAIGSDLALMNLDSIARKVKSKSLQQHAQSRIEAIAAARELSADELADRLVPDLGLGSDGRLTLDFGPRAFTVGFDQYLRPYALDSNRARLKDIPKPSSSDDAALAAAAIERWKLLKKDAKAIASQQIQRLEALMCSGREVELEVFLTCFVQHPLLRHLAQRLLWGERRADGSLRLFRIAEDLSFADADDRQLTLADDGMISLVHSMKLDAEQRSTWRQIFADYEILQPFSQLGRELFECASDENEQCELNRFAGKRVGTASVFGLQQHGWRTASSKGRGHIGWFEKSLPSNLEARIQLDPGTSVETPMLQPNQTLGALQLFAVDGGSDVDPRPFKLLDATARSELLRDIDRLTS
ncbi:DUF4132 domain-containing protein [Pseudomarimonas arenosa]|uniref:DUF4132 domain-containing protein n=1 Tax=Pseudomarimonas arenosa TaxID=2774145 RepID=A0AAW3ZGJ8_9GAMM|nr:DUF4132 domain-containing protein [Pseudomarimonas arenosa]MBD8524689.1 DUF4132 domain-containing protein [Pseudomarimonas arenosa]